MNMNTGWSALTNKGGGDLTDANVEAKLPVGMMAELQETLVDEKKLGEFESFGFYLRMESLEDLDMLPPLQYVVDREDRGEIWQMVEAKANKRSAGDDAQPPAAKKPAAAAAAEAAGAAGAQ